MYVTLPTPGAQKHYLPTEAHRVEVVRTGLAARAESALRQAWYLLNSSVKSVLLELAKALFTNFHRLHQTVFQTHITSGFCPYDELRLRNTKPASINVLIEFLTSLYMTCKNFPVIFSHVLR